LFTGFFFTIRLKSLKVNVELQSAKVVTNIVGLAAVFKAISPSKRFGSLNPQTQGRDSSYTSPLYDVLHLQNKT